MYYVLTNPVAPNETAASVVPDRRFRRSWYTGAKHKVAPPNPLLVTWNADTESGVRKAFYEAGTVLMLKTLLTTLRDAGVENIDTYPVVIKSTTGNADCEDYVAVNILGLVSAVDLSKSTVLDESDGPLLSVTFDGFALDPSRIRNQLLFRLAESASTVIVHKHVVERVRAAGGFGLSFVDPADHVT